MRHDMVRCYAAFWVDRGSWSILARFGHITTKKDDMRPLLGFTGCIESDKVHFDCTTVRLEDRGRLIYLVFCNL